MFIELTYFGEKRAINCDAIYEITEGRVVYIDDGGRIEWFKCKEPFDEIKTCLLKPGSKFILLHSNDRIDKEILINIDHIKSVVPKDYAREIEMLWSNTTNSEYVTETYDEIMSKISNSGFVCLMKDARMKE